jgi:hypothetical protein
VGADEAAEAVQLRFIAPTGISWNRARPREHRFREPQQQPRG